MPSKPETDQEAADRQTTSLAAMAAALFFVVVGLYIVNVLKTKIGFEDCVLSGRPTCTTDGTPFSGPVLPVIVSAREEPA